MRRLTVGPVVLTFLLSTGGTALAADDEPPALGAFEPTGSLAQARTGHSATLLPDGRVLIAGGDDVSVEPEVWDPSTDTFGPAGLLTDTATAPVPSLAVARVAHSSTPLPDGSFLVVGGRGTGDDLDASAQVYDPATGALALAGSLTTPRSGHTATFLRDGRVLVVGGSTGDGDLASAEIWTSSARPAKCFGQRPTLFALPDVEMVGTDGADVIAGSVGADIIRGGDGNDRICANGGADTVDGGGGNDKLSGGGGDDELEGGAGKDVCTGGKGTDWLPGCNSKFQTRGLKTIRKNTTLKGPHNGRIVFGANKVTLDCAGHTVTGPGAGVGIWLAENWRSGLHGQVRGRTGVTVKNCEVTRFTHGILLSLARRNTLTHNRAHGNSRSGIALHDSSKNKLAWNDAEDNGFGSGPTFGFQLDANSHRNVLKHNSASGSDFNFSVRNSSRNTFENNTASGGSQGFSINGDRNTLRRNTVTGARTTGFSTSLEANHNVFTDNTQTGSSEVGFRIGGTGNTITGNAADDNGQVGFADGSVPGVNDYADNTCINNAGGGSSPEGLCDGSAP